MSDNGNTHEEQARKIAQYWAGQLRVPSKIDNGDDSDTGGMVLMMATLNQSYDPTYSDEQIQKFEDELTSEIVHQLQDPYNQFHFHIGVDYDPDRTLSECAERAGIRLTMTTLPWKTTTSIYEGKVTVSEGCCAEPVEL